MATLTTAQKAPLIVHDANGNEIDANHRTSTVNGTSIQIDTAGVFVFGIAPGTSTITVSAGGSTGELEVTVVAAPLAVTLGTPEPK